MGLLLAALCLVVLGGVLISVAARGRAIDDHPICRKCRFDLIGLMLPAVCPECGSDLSRARALGKGNRVRRPWLMAVAGACLLLGSMGLWGWGGGVDWLALAPDRLLVWQATRSPGRVSSPLATELYRRIVGPDGLSEANVRRLAAAAEAHIRDSTPYNPDLLSLIAEAVKRGFAPGEVWESLIRAGMRFDQVVESGAPPTDRWPIELHAIHDRLWDDGNSEVRLVDAWIDGVRIGGGEPWQEGGSLFGSRGGYLGDYERRYLAPGAGPGPHVLKSRYQVLRRWSDGRLPSVTWDIELETPFEVAAAGSRAVIVRPRPLDAPVPDGLLADPVITTSATGGSSTVTGQVTVSTPLTHIAFAVFARHGARLVRLGSVASGPGEQPAGVRTFGEPVPWEGEAGSSVDLIFRYDQGVAETHFGPRMTAWPGEVIFPAVPIVESP